MRTKRFVSITMAALLIITMVIVMLQQVVLAVEETPLPEESPKGTAAQEPQDNDPSEEPKESQKPESTPKPEEENDVVTAIVIDQDVNVRSKPDTDSDVIMRLSKETQVRLLKHDDAWSRLEYAGMIGYMRNDFLFSKDLPKYCFVSADAVNMRKEPTMDSDILKEFPVGKCLDILDYYDHWYQVTDGESIGYISLDVVIASKYFGESYADTVLFEGMQGGAVVEIQQKLKEKGFFSGVTTGYFGDVTKAAVADFQAYCKMNATGIVGDATQLKLQDPTIKRPGVNPDTGKSGSSYIVPVHNVKLISFNDAEGVLTSRRGNNVFIVTDVYSRIQFTVQRIGGYLHWDCEPLTKADTRNMKLACGGWSWARRPVWVTVNGVSYAASMNCQPHAEDSISGNDFRGMFCIHLPGSKTHPEPGVSCKVDAAHQSAVQYAYNVGKNL
ncbi:MAG: SH3 domain-containing protein [Christensenellales bacterium]|jgi:SH3-like domain-containing protein